MANEQDRLKELLESSLSQVEDYACSIRETTVQNLGPDNILVVEEMNSALLCIEELALQLERFVLMCKDKLKDIVPEPTEQSGDDDIDLDDVVPFDWSPPPDFVYIPAVMDELYHSDGSIREVYDSDMSC